MIKTGRPPKLKRNLEICKIIDENLMTRREIMEMYNVSESRLSRIINSNWEEYKRSRLINK